MGIFTALYEAKYKGGKRKKGYFSSGDPVEWVVVGEDLFLKGFTIKDHVKGRTNLVVHIGDVFNNQRRSSVGFFKDSPNPKIIYKKFGTRHPFILDDLKESTIKFLGKVNIVRKGKIVSYFYED